jgi:hypothetical protein
MKDAHKIDPFPKKYTHQSGNHTFLKIVYPWAIISFPY